MARTSEKWADHAKRHLKAESKRADVGCAELGSALDGDGSFRNGYVSGRQGEQGGFPSVVSARRHARHWRTYLTCGVLVLGLCCGGQVLGQEKSGKKNEANTRHTQTEQSPSPPPGVKPTYSEVIDQTACQPSQHRDQADFCVAWRSAKAAEDQAFWAAATCWVGAAGILSIVAMLYYTRVAAEAARVSAQVAERAVEDSAKVLAHAKDTADRDLRPWITIEALLDSPIEIDRFTTPEHENRFSFFAQLRAQNVGRSAARNVVYCLSAADFTEVRDPDEWFENAIRYAVEASESCLPDTDDTIRVFRDDYSDSLAPSERHENKRYCPFSAEDPATRREEKGYEFCTCVVVAYMGLKDDTVFYTAKILPIGFPNVPVFQRFIGPKCLPTGTGSVAFGPVRKARTT